MTSQGLKLSVATLAIAAASASGLLALGASEASAATIAHAQTSMQRDDECCERERGSRSWSSNRHHNRNHNRNHIRNRQWQWQRQHQHQHQSLILNLSFPDREHGAQDNVGQGMDLGQP